jgi:hypothetical protein
MTLGAFGNTSKRPTVPTCRPGRRVTISRTASTNFDAARSASSASRGADCRCDRQSCGPPRGKKSADQTHPQRPYDANHS